MTRSDRQRVEDEDQWLFDGPIVVQLITIFIGHRSAETGETYNGQYPMSLLVKWYDYEILIEYIHCACPFLDPFVTLLGRRLLGVYGTRQCGQSLVEKCTKDVRPLALTLWYHIILEPAQIEIDDDVV